MSASSGPPGDPPLEFVAFFVREMPRLIPFIMRLGASFHDAHDVAQQSFVEVLTRWSQIAHPRAYLRTVASREYIRRSCASERETPVDEVPDMLAEPDLSLAKVEFRDQELRVFAAIRDLPARQRQVVAWTLDGFTPAEIAPILGLPPGAVRGNLFKARRRLRETLDLDGGGEGHA